MLPIPEWAPAVHPLIVHFPLALLFVAAGADLAALVLPRWPWLRPVATGLFALGAVTAVIAFYTGRSAADGVILKGAAEPVLSEHATWAARTVWYFVLYGIARLVREWRYPTRRPALEVAAVVLGLVGLPLLVATGEHGAQMVYQYGVGVQAATGGGKAHDHAAHGQAAQSESEAGHQEGGNVTHDDDHGGDDGGHRDVDHDDDHGG